MIVQALVVEKSGDPFEYQDVQLEDTIRDDEVLVEMKATGVLVPFQSEISDVIETLLKSAAKKGIVVTVGVGKIMAEVSINIFEAVHSARTYAGCVMRNCFPPEFISMFIHAWKDGKFPFDELIKRYATTDMETVVKDTLSGQVVKAVLKWS